MTDIQTVIETAWENIEALTPATSGEIPEAVDAALEGLDAGTCRVAEKSPDGTWMVQDRKSHV